MSQTPIHILEARAEEHGQSVAITAAITADASQAMCVALSEQLDRHRRLPTETAEDVRGLREQTALVERFEPLATAGAHAIVRFTAPELRTSVMDLTHYAERVDGEHFQSIELRERLQLIAQIIPVLWDANAAAAAAAAAGGGEPLTRATP